MKKSNINKKNTPKRSFNETQDSQQGVALIVAILVIGIVVLMVMTISKLMITEFRLTGSLDKSITGYYASESGMEDALLLYKESSNNLNNIDIPSGATDCSATSSYDPCYSVCLASNICYTVEIDVDANKIYSTGTAFGVTRKLEVEPISFGPSGPVNLIDEILGIGTGSFENDSNGDGFPDNWIPWYDPDSTPPFDSLSYQMDNSAGNQSDDGTYSLKFTQNISDPSSDTIQNSSKIPVDTNNGYITALDVKLENLWTVKAEVVCFNNTNTFIGRKTIIELNSPPNSDWTTYSLNLSREGSAPNQFPTGTASIEINVYFQTNLIIDPSYIWIDNVRFYEN